jgi:hypothetical protein
MNIEEKPFEILSPTKVRLNAEARAWAKEWGMTEKEMARHLLNQAKQNGEG